MADGFRQEENRLSRWLRRDEARLLQELVESSLETVAADERGESDGSHEDQITADEMRELLGPMTEEDRSMLEILANTHGHSVTEYLSVLIRTDAIVTLDALAIDRERDDRERENTDKPDTDAGSIPACMIDYDRSE